MTQGKVATVARQSAALFAVQVALLIVQLGYTALTARLFDPEAFGKYAVASAVTSIGSLLAVNGVAKAAARRGQESQTADRQLAGAALAWACFLAALLVLCAPLLAGLWANAGATGFIRLLALSIVPAAYAGVTVGVLRRRGRITELTAITLIAGLAGIGIGVAAVLATESALALVAMPLATAVGQALLAGVRVGRSAVPLRPSRAVTEDLIYSVKSSGYSISSYVIYTTPLWVLSRVAGPATLGSWNRAVAITQVPVETASRSWVTVAFPHFRHGPGAESGRRAWSDLAAASAWLAVPVGLGLAPAVHYAVAVILGPQWGVAAEMAVWLWIAACLSLVVTVLSTAVESAGRFRVLWVVQAVSAILMVIATVGIWVSGDWRWLAAGYVLTSLLGWIALVVMANREDLVEGAMVLKWWAWSVLAGIGVAAIPALVAWRTGSGWASAGVSILAVAAFLLASFALRDRLTVVRGLLRR